MVPEQRVQVKAKRFRVPDITVIAGSRPDGGIVTTTPFLCVEVLSPRDRVVEMRARVQDYLDFGVPNVWVVDPKTRLAAVYTRHGATEVCDGILTTTNPEITVDLNSLE